MHFHIKLVNAFISVFFVRVVGALACFNFFFKEGQKNFEILLLGGFVSSFKTLVVALAGAVYKCACNALAIFHSILSNVVDLYFQYVPLNPLLLLLFAKVYHHVFGLFQTDFDGKTNEVI